MSRKLTLEKLDKLREIEFDWRKLKDKNQTRKCLECSKKEK